MISQDVAPYAVRRETARGRLYAEDDAPTRSAWQRDRDRVIHSAGFRTLQYKTQVFINHEGDFFARASRTRLRSRRLPGLLPDSCSWTKI